MKALLLRWCSSQPNSSVSRVIADMAQNQFIMRGAQGLLAELHKSGAFDQAQRYADQLATPNAARESYNAQFLLPKIMVVDWLIDQFMHGIDS